MEQEDEYIDKSSEVGKLILRVSQLEKRPTLDNSLGEILDAFLQSLVRSNDFLKHGIFKINFAESALLLQSSALIYSKKVDLLWDMVNDCQKRLISFKIEENETELKRIEERERKYKRSRKPIETVITKELKKTISFHADWEELNVFQHLLYEKDSKLYSGWYKKMVSKWDSQLIPNSKKSLADKQIQFGSSENAIFDRDQDNEFVAYTSKMESVIGLEELLLPVEPLYNDFSFKLYSELYLIPKYLQDNCICYEDSEKYSLEVEKFLEYYKDEYFQTSDIFNETLISEKGPQKLRRLSVSSTIVSRLDMPDFDNIYLKTCQVNVLRLSIEDLSRLSRLSVDELKKYCSEEENYKLDHFQEILTEDKDDINCNFMHSTPHVITGGKDVENNDFPTGLSKSIDCNGDKLNSTDISTNISEKSLRNNSKTKNNLEYEREIEFEKNKRRITDRRKSDHEIPEKRKKLSQSALKKLATGLTADFNEFNSFFSAHYQPEEGEGQVEISEFALDDPCDSSSVIGLNENPLSLLSDHPILCTQDSGYESHFQDHEDFTEDDIISPVSQLNQSEKSLGQELNSENCIDDKEKPLYQRVYEWKQYMSEKFKDMKSADFNIHNYGSNIMENFEENRPQKFSEIVKGKSAAEVTRYFISALQLANTSNVEIQGAQSGKLSNDTFELKLITKERYYDRLKDYMAPSEQDYHKRLSSVYKTSKKRSVPSSLGEFSGCKKNKFV